MLYSKIFLINSKYDGLSKKKKNEVKQHHKKVRKRHRTSLNQSTGYRKGPVQLLLPNNVSSSKDLLDFYLCMSVCATCVCWGPQRPEESIRSLRVGVTG